MAADPLPSKTAARSEAPAVLQVLPHMDNGGMQRHVVDLAKHAAKAGWKVHIASTGGALERDLVGHKARHVHMPVDSRSPWTQLFNTYRLAGYAKEHGIKLIHVHDPRCGWCSALAARRSDAAFLSTVHRAIDVKGPIDRFLKRVVVMGDRVIASSHHIASQLISRLGAEENRIRIVYRGVDLDMFDRDAIRGHRIAKLAERWGISHNRKIVLLPGRVIAENGHETALKAVKAMDRTDFDIVIIGEQERGNNYLNRLATEIETLGLDGRVRFGGYCDDVPAALALADLVILPATSGDGSGRALLEAQAMGVPIIVSSVGSFEELVLPASTGWLVKPGDEGELAWAMERALAMDDDVKARIAERARSFINAEFSVERMCERTLAVYEELRRTTA